MMKMEAKIKYTALLPEVERQRNRIHILADRCKGCGFCIEFCPNQVLVIATEFNAKGFFPPTAAHEEKCVNCRLCELICPDMAIYVVAEEEEEEAKSDGDR